MKNIEYEEYIVDSDDRRNDHYSRLTDNIIDLVRVSSLHSVSLSDMDPDTSLTYSYTRSCSVHGYEVSNISFLFYAI